MYDYDCPLCGITHLSTTKRQQEQVPNWKLAVGVITIIVVVVLVIIIGNWALGIQEKWRDTGVVLAISKQLDQSPGSMCCNWIQNITVLSDHHGQINWLDSQSCLGGSKASGAYGTFKVGIMVAIKVCNNGGMEMYPDP